MLITEIAFASPAYDETIGLRDVVLRQPLKLEFSIVDLAAEWDSFHLAAYDADWGLLGCLVLQPRDETTIKMRQVAVQPGLQKQGVGTALVRASEQLARRAGFQTMMLHARKTAVPFYLRLNYRKTGQQFTEVNIPHYRMEKDLRTGG